MKKLFLFAATALLSISMFAENITVAKVVEIGEGLAVGAETTESYSVEGWVVKLYGTYSAKYGSQSFWMADEKDAEGYFPVEAYQCTASKGVAPGAKVIVTGKIKRYKENSYNILGSTEIVADAEPVEMTFAEALTAVKAINDPQEKKSNYGKYVKFQGFVTSDYAAEDGKQTAWLAGDASANRGDIQAFKLAVTEDALKGAKVEVVGVLAKYMPEGKTEATLEIVEGTMTVLEQPTAIENTTVNVKATKVMENGQLYIIRNGIKYNAAGAVVE